MSKYKYTSQKSYKQIISIPGKKIETQANTGPVANQIMANKTRIGMLTGNPDCKPGWGVGRAVA